MRTAVTAGIALAAGIGIGVLVGRPVGVPDNASTAAAPAVEAPKGGQDQTGPYTVAANWPKPLSQLPGHEKWTWGAVQGIFAESPNRVFILMRGELPLLDRPVEVPYPNIGPSISFPVSRRRSVMRRSVPSRAPAIRAVTAGTDGRGSWASMRAGSTTSSS